MLELKHVSVDVNDGGKEILKDISLTINDDEFVVITGPNGGGKSTLAKMIAGMMPLSSGQILLDGKDISQLNITERANAGISFAFQQPVRFKGITVRDLLELAVGKKIDENQLCLYLHDVGLCPKDYIDRDVDGSLSGGEIKRIEIAMIMARKTKLTIFDEPEAGIDLWSFNNLIDVFGKLRSETKGSIIVISHQERILDIADRIIVLSEGKIIAQGTRNEILPALLGEHAKCGFCIGEGIDFNEYNN